MLILEINHLKKYYKDKLIINIDNLKIYNEDKIGIVGVNGAGKSTLLNLIADKVKPDEGDIKIYGSYSYITQMDEPEDQFVDKKIIREFNIHEKDKRFMSGGEKSKLKIAQAFSKDINILFADEPTCNLDIEGIKKLQMMLKAFNGAVLLVSHDRELMDGVCNKIINIEDGAIQVYNGNYNDFIEQKTLQRKRDEFEYKQYIKEKRNFEEAIIETNNKSKSIRKALKRMGNSEARLHKMGDQKAKKNLDGKIKAVQSRIDRLEKKEKPKDIEKIQLDFKYFHKVHSKIVIEGKAINKSFGNKKILENANFQVYNSSKVALIGDNGCGKTTLINMILNKENGLKVSEGLKIGYFSQNFSVLNKDKTIIENLKESSIYDESFSRIVLSRLLFKGEDVFKKVSTLSGGERVKASFAKIILSDFNILILDEPTNYLDIYSMEAFENVLKDCKGTVILVSHDRRFVNKVADNIIIFKSNKLMMFDGNYNEYMESLESKKYNKNSIDKNIMILENRLSQLIGRISMPSKKDNVEELDKEYKFVLKELNSLKRKSLD